RQSQVAIGSGQKTGRGPEHATQTKLDFLPEHHTDFVFSVVGEEFGFMGAALVLSLYALLIWRALRILTMAKNLYGALIAGGVAAMLEAEGKPPASGNGASKGGRRGRGGGSRKGAVPQGWRVGELYIERRWSRSIVGNIYKGRVDNVLPGLEAAFVDIGIDKNGFLHVDDIVMPGVEVQRRGRVGGKGQRIAQLLKPGRELIVQVGKDPLRTTGARMSMQLSIAGRYLVYVPQGEGVGVSRRLEDSERDKLRRRAGKIDLRGGGAIIRTAARGASREDFEREIKYLHKLHEI